MTRISIESLRRLVAALWRVVQALVLTFAGSLGGEGVALARDPLQPGMDVNDHAAIGAVVGDDPTELYQNPANLKLGPADETTAVGFGELTLTAVHATYNHPDYVPFAYNAVAPIAAVGGAYEISDRASVALCAFPSGVNSAINLGNLPVDILPTQSGEAHVQTKVTGYELAVGTALRIASATELGLSVIQTYAHDKIHITIDGLDQTFDDADIKGVFYKEIFGIRQQLGKWTLAGSVAPAVVQRYHGTSEMPALGFPDPYSVTMTTYSPLTVQVGTTYKFGKTAINGEYAYEGYAAGRNVTQSGMNPNDSVGANLHNASDLSFSADWTVGPRDTLFAGVGFFQGDQGGGLYPGTRGPDDHGEGGMRFGNFDGINRYAVGGGYKTGHDNIGVEIGGFLNYGATSVPASEPQQGTYSLFLGGLGSSVTVAF